MRLRRTRSATRALGGMADVVLSDMAAAVTGHKSTDHWHHGFVRRSARVATEMVAAGRLMKAFAGGAHSDLMSAINKDFENVRTVKPDAATQVRTYIVAIGFRGWKKR